MTVDEPVPVRRAAVGCLLIAAAGLVLVLLVRPAIFLFAPPRDDSAVTVATATEVAGGPMRHDLLLSRSYGWDGERLRDDGRVEMTIVVAPNAFGGVTAVAAASPLADDCPIEIGADRLLDCDGRAWTYAGVPLDPADPPLDRFPVRVEGGTVAVDLTRLADP